MRRLLLTGVIIMAMTGTGFTNQPAVQAAANTGGPSDSHHGAPWFDGTVEQAFAKAKTENRSVFLYWGAVWCPPCNYLKAQVFDAPRFAEIMKPTIAVYLDGDSETAQQWGAKFKAEGYPTIILFNADGKEKLRMDHAMSFDEFEKVLTAAVAESASLKDIVARALLGKASDADWRMITGVYWSIIDESVYPEANHVSDRLKLFALAPKTKTKERARLAAGLLDSGLSAQGEESRKKIEDSIKAQAPELFAAIFADKEAIRSARELIAYMQNEYIGWFSPELSAAKSDVIKSWHEAHLVLNSMADLPADIHLGTAMGEVYLFQQENKDKPIPDNLKLAVRTAAEHADKVSTSEHQRVAAIPSAAYYLREIGDYDQARKLLDKELKTTKVPWYYQSTYAGVEKAAGNNEKALYWAEQARLSAQGRASKIQWIFNEISLVNKMELKDKDARLSNLLTIYFDTALGFSDGFSGRNANRMRSITKIIKPLLAKKQFADIAAKYKGLCSKSDAKQECQKYFADLTSST